MTSASRSSCRALALLLVFGCAAPASTARPPAPVPSTRTASAASHVESTRPFDDYAGQYRATDNPELVISIYADSGRQWMQPTDNPRF